MIRNSTFFLILVKVAFGVVVNHALAQAQDHPDSKDLLTEQEVVSHAIANLSLIQMNLSKYEQAKNKLQSAEGSFDLKLKMTRDERLEGYYDGNIDKIQVQQETNIWGAELYAGFRQGEGAFPTYEGKSKTLKDGEWFGGISLSLLRDGYINPNIANLKNRELDKQVARYEANLKSIKIILEAQNAYWNWVVAHNDVKIAERLLNFAEVRQKALSKRVQKGDLAKIYLTENETYIQKRQIKKNEAEIRLFNAQRLLALYYPINQHRYPDLLQENQTHHSVVKEEEKPVEIDNHFLIRSLKQQLEKEDNNERLAKNQMLPSIDLKIERSDDSGRGSSTLDPGETRVWAEFSLPLERRKARGKRALASNRKKFINYQIDWFRSQLRAELQQLRHQITRYQSIISQARSNVRLNKKLEQAERTRFKNGASDFFLINIREENTAEAYFKLLSTIQKFQKIYNKLKAFKQVTDIDQFII